MKALTQFLVRDIIKQFPEEEILPVICRAHPEAPLRASYDVKDKTLVLYCDQCERILVEQPID